MVTAPKAVRGHAPLYRGTKVEFRYGNQSSPDVTGNFPWICYPLGLDYRTRQ